MQNIQNMIARHSWLTAGIKRCSITGQRVPPQVRAELQRIEARAQAMLSPQELQGALQASQTMQAQHIHQAELQAAAQEANHRVAAGDALAKEMTGFDQGQIESIRRGEKYTVKSEGPNIAEGDAKLRAMLTGVGKKDMTRKQFDRLSDRYEEVKGVRGDGAAAAWAKRNFGDKAPQGVAMIEAWQESGLGLQMGLAERRGGAAPDEEVEPSERDTLRATIAHEWVTKAKDDEQVRDSIIEDGAITDEYMESDEIHGDIARAMAECESKEEESYV